MSSLQGTHGPTAFGRQFLRNLGLEILALVVDGLLDAEVKDRLPI
jgi:hypothetical protein